MTGAAGSPTEPGPVVDARGLRCPIPVIRLAAAARSATAGTEVTVLWTDPAARYDIPAWVRMRGHQLVATVPFTDDTAAVSSADTPAVPSADTSPAYATTIRLHPCAQA